ncbi:MAG: transcriptional regulator, LacI family [Chthonomonadaceae bacterium]|nr:transcriptional regulator, LacI family [Chthonomonadaceae bacterium]
MRVTIKNIASELGLSHATISRALNDRKDPFISDATRLRVRQAAEQMGYRPNLAARALATGRTQLIALWLKSLLTGYHAHVAHYMELQARQHSRKLVINILGGPDDMQTGGEEDAAWNVDGIIAHENSGPVRRLLAQYPSSSIPIVTTGTYSYLADGDMVGIDLYSGAREAMEHLVASGHRRIAYLVNGTSDFPAEPRRKAYTGVMGEAGLPEEGIVTTDQLRATARNTVRAYVQEHGCPTALFCHNDDMAIGAYRGLLDAGLRVPDDIALIGCDGIEDTTYLECPLSTIVQPVEAMCALAWQFLERRIADPQMPPQQVTLQSHLAIRESSQS